MKRRASLRSDCSAVTFLDTQQRAGRHSHRNAALATGIALLVLGSALYLAAAGAPARQSPSGASESTASQPTTGPSSTSNSTSAGSADYAFFVQPNLANIEALREWFMSPFDASTQKIGYDPNYGMIRGGYWAGGFKDGFVLIDTQLILASSLDYFNSLSGVHTDIEANTRSWLNGSFIDPSTGAAGTYNGTDRREVLFGATPACIRNDSGQVFYVENHTLSDPVPITTALPTSCASDSPGGMNVYAPWIELYYHEGATGKAEAMFNLTLSAWTSTPGTGVGHTTGGYFSDTFDSGPDQGKCKSSRSLGYWIEMARATGFWNLDNESRTVAEEAMHELWAHQESDGSISVNYPGCKNDVKASGESSGITLLAFDPRVPAWFGAAATSSSLAPLRAWSPGSGSSASLDATPVPSMRATAPAPQAAFPPLPASFGSGPWNCPPMVAVDYTPSPESQ